MDINNINTNTKEKKEKSKRRNNEKRKEKSRDAARSRRSRETEIFSDLANALPLNSEQVSQLDKASVMRLAISYLKVRDMVNLVPELLKLTEKKTLVADETIFLKSLEGFLVVLTSDGDFVYLSENVSDFLGISQIDLMGQNVFEYSHPCDHEELREILSSKTQEECNSPKSFFIRLKCTLTSKGRSVNLKSATYKVIHCTGHMVRNTDETNKGILKSCLMAIGQPIPHPSNIETPLPKQTFLTKHSLDMKFTYADDKIMLDVLGYNSEDLIGKSVYEYHHAMDSDSIGSAYKCLFSKGQCETNRYRFLAKTGGFVWVVTQATLIYDKMQKPQSVVCVNYIISGVECRDEIYSASQYSSAVKSEKLCTNNNNTNAEVIVPVPLVEDSVKSKNIPITNHSNIIKKENIIISGQKPVAITAQLISNYQPQQQQLEPPVPVVTVTPPQPLRPQTATSKIFVNRTEEMNKGFLTFSDEEPGLTMLKDEPEDLTHLAPEAGDVCVPLDNHPFLDDVLDDFLLRDNFGPLLNDEPTDPFISYRDFHDPSPNLLSPNLSKASDCSLPSLNSPSDSLGDEEQMTFINLQMDDDPDLAMKAPYIPMNLADDLPLLMANNDLMWSSHNDKNKSIPDSNSSLAQLLSSSVSKHSLKSNDHGGGIAEQDSHMEELYNNKNSNWSNNNRNKSNTKKSQNQQQENQIKSRIPSTKRSNSTICETANKRTKNEPKEKMSSELLQQLMSSNQHRGRPKGKSNWLLDSGGQKAACISQPSDSVLMNLLDDPIKMSTEAKLNREKLSQIHIQQALDREKSMEIRRNTIRKNSISLLEPEATAIPSLLDLTQQDFEVNAPVNSFLLQGEDLLTALEINGSI